MPEVAVYLPTELLATVEDLARREDRSRSAEIRWLLRLGLERLIDADLNPPEYDDD